MCGAGTEAGRCVIKDNAILLYVVQEQYCRDHCDGNNVEKMHRL